MVCFIAFSRIIYPYSFHFYATHYPHLFQQKSHAVHGIAKQRALKDSACGDRSALPELGAAVETEVRCGGAMERGAWRERSGGMERGAWREAKPSDNAARNAEHRRVPTQRGMASIT
jgi:hypothetical protein